jgi:probable HAF family extracellular repeat protein
MRIGIENRTSITQSIARGGTRMEPLVTVALAGEDAEFPWQRDLFGRSAPSGVLRFSLLACLAVASLAPSSPKSLATPLPPGYRVTDLGVLPAGISSSAVAINAVGQVVGTSKNAGGQYRAVLFSGGKAIDLGTLSGDSGSVAEAINAAGQIVGQSYTDPAGTYHAALFRVGSVTNLGTIPGGNYAVAYGINAKGQAVGFSTGPGTGFSEHAALFRVGSGTVTDLGPGIAYAINDRGQAVGFSRNLGAGETEATLYNAGKVINLGTLPGGSFSIAYAINDRGQAVGYSTAADDHTYAALFLRHRVLDLGTLPGAVHKNEADLSAAFAINAQGLAVGYSYNAAGQQRPVLFTGTSVIDLTSRILPGSPFLTLYSARGINDRGQIVGAGEVQGGATHAYFLTPAPVGVTPEPSSLALLSVASLGLVGYGWLRRRRR